MDSDFSADNSMSFDSGKKNLVGVCMQMCSQRQIEDRIISKDVDIFEKTENPATGQMEPNPSLFVKKFKRAAADKNPDPIDVRPPVILKQTAEYLLASIINRTDVPFSTVHAFIRDRMRAIRKDFSVQGILNTEMVEIYEQCARFHILSYHECAYDPYFDVAQNNEQLEKCLISLEEFYQDLHLQGITCPNEAEFQAYNLVFNAHNFSAYGLRSLNVEVIRSPWMALAFRIVALIRSNNTGRVLKLIKGENGTNINYLFSCLLFRQIKTFRQVVWDTVVMQSCQRGAKWRVGELREIMLLSNDEEVLELAEKNQFLVEDGPNSSDVSMKVVHFPPITAASQKIPLTLGSPQRIDAISNKRGSLTTEQIVRGALTASGIGSAAGMSLQSGFTAPSSSSIEHTVTAREAKKDSISLFTATPLGSILRPSGLSASSASSTATSASAHFPKPTEKPFPSNEPLLPSSNPFSFTDTTKKQQPQKPQNPFMIALNSSSNEKLENNTEKSIFASIFSTPSSKGPLPSTSIPTTPTALSGFPQSSPISSSSLLPQSGANPLASADNPFMSLPAKHTSDSLKPSFTSFDNLPKKDFPNLSTGLQSALSTAPQKEETAKGAQTSLTPTTNVFTTPTTSAAANPFLKNNTTPFTNTLSNSATSAPSTTESKTPEFNIFSSFFNNNPSPAVSSSPSTQPSSAVPSQAETKTPSKSDVQVLLSEKVAPLTTAAGDNTFIKITAVPHPAATNPVIFAPISEPPKPSFPSTVFESSEKKEESKSEEKEKADNAIDALDNLPGFNFIREIDADAEQDQLSDDIMLSQTPTPIPIPPETPPTLFPSPFTTQPATAEKTVQKSPFNPFLGGEAAAQSTPSVENPFAVGVSKATDFLQQTPSNLHLFPANQWMDAKTELKTNENKGTECLVFPSNSTNAMTAEKKDEKSKVELSSISSKDEGNEMAEEEEAQKRESLKKFEEKQAEQQKSAKKQIALHRRTFNEKCICMLYFTRWKKNVRARIYSSIQDRSKQSFLAPVESVEIERVRKDFAEAEKANQNGKSNETPALLAMFAMSSTATAVAYLNQIASRASSTPYLTEHSFPQMVVDVLRGCSLMKMKKSISSLNTDALVTSRSSFFSLHIFSPVAAPFAGNKLNTATFSGWMSNIVRFIMSAASTSATDTNLQSNSSSQSDSIPSRILKEIEVQPNCNVLYSASNSTSPQTALSSLIILPPLPLSFVSQFSALLRQLSIPSLSNTANPLANASLSSFPYSSSRFFNADAFALSLSQLTESLTQYIREADSVLSFLQSQQFQLHTPLPVLFVASLLQEEYNGNKNAIPFQSEASSLHQSLLSFVSSDEHSPLYTASFHNSSLPIHPLSLLYAILHIAIRNVLQSTSFTLLIHNPFYSTSSSFSTSRSESLLSRLSLPVDESIQIPAEQFIFSDLESLIQKIVHATAVPTTRAFSVEYSKQMSKCQLIPHHNISFTHSFAPFLVSLYPLLSSSFPLFFKTMTKHLCSTHKSDSTSPLLSSFYQATSANNRLSSSAHSQSLISLNGGYALSLCLLLWNAFATHISSSISEFNAQNIPNLSEASVHHKMLALFYSSFLSSSDCSTIFASSSPSSPNQGSHPTSDCEVEFSSSSSLSFMPFASLVASSLFPVCGAEQKSIPQIPLLSCLLAAIPSPHLIYSHIKAFFTCNKTSILLLLKGSLSIFPNSSHPFTDAATVLVVLCLSSFIHQHVFLTQLPWKRQYGELFFEAPEFEPLTEKQKKRHRKTKNDTSSSSLNAPDASIGAESVASETSLISPAPSSNFACAVNKQLRKFMGYDGDYGESGSIEYVEETSYDLSKVRKDNSSCDPLQSSAKQNAIASLPDDSILQLDIKLFELADEHLPKIFNKVMAESTSRQKQKRTLEHRYKLVKKSLLVEDHDETDENVRFGKDKEPESSNIDESTSSAFRQLHWIIQKSIASLPFKFFKDSMFCLSEVLLERVTPIPYLVLLWTSKSTQPMNAVAQSVSERCSQLVPIVVNESVNCTSLASSVALLVFSSYHKEKQKENRLSRFSRRETEINEKYVNLMRMKQLADLANVVMLKKRKRAREECDELREDENEDEDETDDSKLIRTSSKRMKTSSYGSSEIFDASNSKITEDEKAFAEHLRLLVTETHNANYENSALGVGKRSFWSPWETEANKEEEFVERLKRMAAIPEANISNCQSADNQSFPNDNNNESVSMDLDEENTELLLEHSLLTCS
ncbi:putative nuclear export factor Sac3 [Monocercomonoides exilis]|uniref:putative nuclear export factor Sac3 n=1 Tax=Monocercomonoides exilis TaxID=2049356 RepID=UPI003559FB4E|nr:putative nuclear export factor Sac3 [Monocercomonoides exilis]|eukprot:MONOS_11262.1-p1 / transcript=MONOS_11262.1 / gene=MONOS_11262 / organism=Monocercomonoides_exilis_PA203 / gene_product=similar to MCM3 associated protein / transcript_product=similar to MCM3 associated protein / location=Mono_scaffold00555:20841-27530(-) / protein_length=2229 / sequence_SO=supercontig / SO=protein_coding / is_pseudo=false